MFKDMGYDRVFPPTVDLKRVVQSLRQDVAVRQPSSKPQLTACAAQ
jgi:hypothetical protein